MKQRLVGADLQVAEISALEEAEARLEELTAPERRLLYLVQLRTQAENRLQEAQAKADDLAAHQERALNQLVAALDRTADRSRWQNLADVQQTALQAEIFDLVDLLRRHASNLRDRLETEESGLASLACQVEERRAERDARQEELEGANRFLSSEDDVRKWEDTLRGWHIDATGAGQQPEELVGRLRERLKHLEQLHGVQDQEEEARRQRQPFTDTGGEA